MREKPIEIDLNLTEMLISAEKEIKTYYNCISMFKRVKRDMEDLKRAQIKILQIKLQYLK